MHRHRKLCLTRLDRGACCALTGSGAAPGHDLTRPLSDALADAPVAMDKRRFQRMTRGKLQPEARIDLHGMTLAQAHAALNGFILRAQANGLRLVLVITGKGRQADDDGPIPRRRGALKHDVPQWLRMAPLAGCVLEIREAHARHGGWRRLLRLPAAYALGRAGGLRCRVAAPCRAKIFAQG